MTAKMNNFSCWLYETVPDVLMGEMEELLELAGFNVRGRLTEFFRPFGFTALWLLSESHLAIHTFPEESRTYLELSSCVDGPYLRFIENLDRIKNTIVEGSERRGTV